MNSCRARIVMIRQVAEAIFKDRLLADAWLRSTNQFLGGRTPLSQLYSSFGTQCVLNELSRIDLGRKNGFSDDSSESGDGRQTAA